MSKVNALPVYDSAERGSRAIEELRELFNYRNLVIQTARRNIVVRYKRSFLGIAWTMLNPLGTSLILSFVFSQAFGGPSDYAVYVLSGIMVWNFFAQTTSDCMNNMIWGGGLLKRIYIPRTAFAVSSIATGAINIMMAFVPLLLVMFITGASPSLAMLILPVPLLFVACFTLGVGLIMSTIAIYFADVAEMYNILLMAWFYLSPVIYRTEMLPQQYLWVFKLNPMFHFINLFRDPIYNAALPPLSSFLLTGGIAVGTLLAGWLIFTWKADEFAYRT